MTDPMEHVGEDVPPSIKPEFALLLGVVRDTMLFPKPIGRDQAALAILCALVQGRPAIMELPNNHAANVAINLADALLDNLERTAR